MTRCDMTTFGMVQIFHPASFQFRVVNVWQKCVKRQASNVKNVAKKALFGI